LVVRDLLKNQIASNFVSFIFNPNSIDL